jgi:hypothetical protein
MKKQTLMMAVCLLAFTSSCQGDKPVAPKKEHDDSNYHDRRTKKPCGSCETEKAKEEKTVAEIAPTTVVPEIKVAPVAEVKTTPAVEPEKKSETAALETK